MLVITVCVWVCVCDREIGGYLMYVVVLKPELMYKGERERLVVVLFEDMC